MDKFNNRLTKIRSISFIIIIAISFVFLDYVYSDKKNILIGFYNILTNPAILITDFIYVGGLGASFLNAFLILFFNIFLVKLFKIKIDGTVIANFCSVFGFSFFGKNILNILPFFLGGILYTLYSHTDFKENLLTISFSSALAPFVSAVAFNTQNSEYDTSYFSAIFLGIIIGFIIVPLSKAMFDFHKGFALYNVGFTAGILGTVILAIMKLYNFELIQQNLISNEYDVELKVMCTLASISIFSLGYFINGRSFEGFIDLSLDNGYKVDFTQKYGYGLTFMNMGLIGIVGIIFVEITGENFSGPILAGLFTLVGFSVKGKTLLNILPILIGIYIAKFGTNTSSFILSISGLFGTALAPIAGVYGFIPGIIAGWLHIAVVQNIGFVHGGMNLYNNGFSAGIVAGVLTPLIDMIIKKKTQSKILLQKRHKDFIKTLNTKLKDEIRKK